MIQSVRGDLDLDGELTIDIHGLVPAEAPSVPASLQGTNPVPFFAATSIPSRCASDPGHHASWDLDDSAHTDHRESTHHRRRRCRT
jgi:hypothetical protein